MKKAQSQTDKKKQLTAFQQDLINYKPKTDVITGFKQEVNKMLNHPKHAANGVCVWGGDAALKNEIVKQTLQEEGLVDGLGYVIVKNRIKDDYDLINILYNNRNIPFVVINNSDNLFADHDMALTIKYVLEDQKLRFNSINEKIIDKETDKPLKPSNIGYDVESHYIFLAKKNPAITSVNESKKQLLRLFDFNINAK